MRNSFPKSVYRTPNPEFNVSEVYEISIAPVPGVSDQHRCWIVRELHGYYDEKSKTYEQTVETLNSGASAHLFTCDEAIHQANNQVLLRAQNGFRFLFIMNYLEPSPPWYERFEVALPEGQYRALP
jgi:hypothetical protein